MIKFADHKHFCLTLSFHSCLVSVASSSGSYVPRRPLRRLPSHHRRLLLCQAPRRLPPRPRRPLSCQAPRLLPRQYHLLWVRINVLTTALSIFCLSNCNHWIPVFLLDADLSCANPDPPCQNGSTCQDSSDGEEGYSCDCQDGWTGTYCGIPTSAAAQLCPPNLDVNVTLGPNSNPNGGFVNVPLQQSLANVRARLNKQSLVHLNILRTYFSTTIVKPPPLSRAL